VKDKHYKLDSHIDRIFIMAVISFSEKAGIGRAGSLFLRLLWLDELSNEGLDRVSQSDNAGDIETLISLTDEMISLLERLPPAVFLLLQIAEKSDGFVNAAFSAVAARNAEYFTSRVDAFHVEPALLVERLERAGGFENAVLNSAKTLLSESTGLRESLERRKRDIADLGIAQADFPHRIACAQLISAAFCTLVSGIAMGVPLLAAGGAVAILAAEGTTAGAFLTTIASAVSLDCFHSFNDSI
jgi:hypothetical protein